MQTNGCVVVTAAIYILVHCILPARENGAILCPDLHSRQLARLSLCSCSAVCPHFFRAAQIFNVKVADLSSRKLKNR